MVRIFKFIYWLAIAPKHYYSPLSFKYYIFLVSYLRCYLKGKFSIDELFELGLGSSWPSEKDIDKYISFQKISEIDKVLNPSSWHMITINKGIFSMVCKSLKLPIPNLYATIFKDNASFSYLNSSFIKRENLVNYIRNDLPDEFVIKPESGGYGRFINIYTKTNDGIIDGDGNLRSEKDIINSIFSIKRYKSFIVQERLKNHPDILKIFPSKYLHTLRLITLIEMSGHCKILHAHLNVATEQNFASQLSDLKISISLNDGYMEYGISIDKIKGGFKRVTEYSETNQNFKEFKMPFWEDVTSLAEEAAFKFLPLRTLGWDIAITEKGLKILETNNPYTPPNFFKPMDKFIKSLLES